MLYNLLYNDVVSKAYSQEQNIKLRLPIIRIHSKIVAEYKLSILNKSGTFKAIYMDCGKKANSVRQTSKDDREFCLFLVWDTFVFCFEIICHSKRLKLNFPLHILEYRYMLQDLMLFPASCHLQFFVMFLCFRSFFLIFIHFLNYLLTI